MSIVNFKKMEILKIEVKINKQRSIDMKNKQKTRRCKRYIRKQVKRIIEKIEKTEIKVAGL